ncbi:MAG: HAD family phosphatase [Clostridia bacterium]|nr:HAD family phosphatase [Clostridia bacterium]
MPNYDILFIDMDGTLLGADHLTVSERTRRTLKAAQEAGVKLAVASGRTLKILPDVIWELDFDYALVSNGAAIYDLRTGEKVYSRPYPIEAARKACELIVPEAEFIEFFADGEIILSREHYEWQKTHALAIWHRLYFDKGGTPVVDSIDAYLDAGAPGLEKINLVRQSPEVVRRAHERLTATGMFKLSDSTGRSIEINAAGCTKGAAIADFCRQLNIPMERSAGFGDANNDIDMLRTVGCAVAMGNALPSVKELADYVTAPNTEDGVAQFIEKYVL